MVAKIATGEIAAMFQRIEKRAQILSMLCEGSSMRAVSRVCDVLNTVDKLLDAASLLISDLKGRRMVAVCGELHAVRQSGSAERVTLWVDLEQRRARYFLQREPTLQHHSATTSPS
jgi:hypothetical protein